MELEKIKENLDNFEIKMNTKVDENNFYLVVDINEVTAEFLKGFIPQSVIDKSEDIFLPSDEVKKRHLIITLARSELQEFSYSLLLFEKELIANNSVCVLITGVDEGIAISTDIERGFTRLVEMSAKVESLKKTVKFKQATKQETEE
jgi:hypothetical protein